MTRLQEILDHKRKEIALLLPRAEHLRAAALQRNDFRGCAAALEKEGRRLGLIAEVKKASPSAGDIVEVFDPVAIALEYEEAGADALSILTDERFFKGSLAYLTRIRGEVGLPVLRKDFILHEAQIFEAGLRGGGRDFADRGGARAGGTVAVACDRCVPATRCAGGSAHIGGIGSRVGDSRSASSGGE